MLHESVHNAATDDFAPTRIFAPRRHRLLLRNPIRKTLLLPARTHARMNVHTPVSTRTERLSGSVDGGLSELRAVSPLPIVPAFVCTISFPETLSCLRPDSGNRSRVCLEHVGSARLCLLAFRVF